MMVIFMTGRYYFLEILKYIGGPKRLLKELQGGQFCGTTRTVAVTQEDLLAGQKE